jgi:hypothetical protein
MHPQGIKGEMNINLLVLALVYKGAAIPIYWLVLNKKGNSDTRERIALMKRFINQFGKENIIAVLADREFTCALRVLAKPGLSG